MVATTLSVGAIAVIGFKTGQSFSAPATTDKIYFVLLAPIGSGTQIHFTDRGWNGTTFAAGGGDGTFTYTAGADLAAGTVIEITAAQLSAAGMDLADLGGEAIYVYQGALDAPTRFLYAIEFGDENTTFGGNLTNTGLTAGYSAVAVGHESAGYVGPTTHAESFLWNGHASTLMHSIADATNWHGDSSDGPGANNAEDPEIQEGPWLKHADLEMWGGIGAGGLGNTLGDGTHASGADDYNHTRQYEGLVNGQTVFWFASDMMFDTAEGKFFVMDSDLGTNNRVLQGNISDLLGNPEAVPTLTVLYTSPTTGTAARMDNMDIDLVNNIIYFTHGSQLIKIGYNTANQAGTMLFDANAQGAISSTTGNPAGSTNNFFNDMDINFTTGSIYLSSTRVLAGASGDAVSKNFIYELTGLTTSSGVNAFTMAGTNNNGTARLLPFAENDLAYNPTGGTPVGSPFSSAQDPYAWALERGTLDGLAINEATNTLYFGTGEILFDHDANSGTAAQYAGGGIFSYALSGNPTGVITTIYQQTAQFGGALPGLIGDIEYDPVTGHIYIVDWAGASNSTTDNHLYRIATAANSTPVQFSQTIGQEGDATTLIGITLNRAPTLNGAAAGGLAVTEASSAPNSGETSRVTLYTGISMSDFETTIADEITGAVVRIGEGFTFEPSSTATGHTGTVDRLYINNLTSGTIAGSGISFIYNQTTGAMVLTGAATAAEYKAAIELVQFSTSGDNVTNNGNANTRTIYVSVSDGLTMSDEISATVNVTGINDAPVNTVGAAISGIIEDSTGTAGNATPPPFPRNAITGLSIGDADADATTETFTVTLSVAHGTLTIRTDVTNGLGAGQVTGNGSASLTLTGTQTQINNTLAAVNNATPTPGANGLVYTPDAHYNGADTLTIVTNDNGNNGNDPGNSGTGTTEADTDTKTLNITNVNDAPIVTDATQDATTILEDTPLAGGQTIASLFTASFSDPLDQQQNGGNPTGSVANTLAGIAIVANDISGATGRWQYFTGGVWTDIPGGAPSAAFMLPAATAIRFTPALNFNGTAPTLTAHLIDSSFGTIAASGQTADLSGGTATGGNTPFSAATVVLSQTVTAVNDAPVNTVGGTTNATEDGGAVNVTGMSIADVEASAAGSQVSVTLDVDHGTLAILTNVPGGITAGHIVSQDSDTISIVAAIAQINATLAAAGGLTYTPDANFNGGDTVEIITSDLGATGQDPVPGTGTATDEQDIDSKTISVAAVNDPIGTVAPGAVSLDEDSVNFAVTGMSITDIDAALAPGGIYVVTLSSTNGTMSLSTLTGLTFSAGDGSSDATMTFRGTLAAINTALATASYTPTANYNGSAQIQLQATDTFGGVVATGTGAATADSNTINVTVNAVNDPVATAAPALGIVAEDSTNVAIPGLSIADADAALGPAGVYEVTLAATHGALTLTTLTGLTFTAGDGTSDATMTFHGTLADINTALATATYTVDANYNGPAEISISATDSFGGVVATGSGAATSDSDTVALTVSAVNDEPAGQDNSAGVAEGTNLVFTAAHFSTGFSDPIDGHSFAGVRITTLPLGAMGTIKLSGTAINAGDIITLADLTAGNLIFEPAAGSAGASPVFTFQVRDDGGTPGVDLDQSPNNFTLNISSPNNVPVLDLDADDSVAAGTGFATSYSEGDSTGVLIADSDVLIADADAGDMIESATIAIQAAVGGDQLTLGVQSGFTVNGSGTATITITGAGSAADYGAIIEQIRFLNSGDNPTNSGAATTRAIHTTVHDGSHPSAAALTTVTISATNDAPVNSLGGTIGTGEDVVDAWLSGMSISDPDANPATDDILVTFDVDHGTLAIRTDVGGGITAGDIVAQDADTITVRATINEINATLAAANGLTYSPAQDYNGQDILTVTTNDRGQTGADAGLSGDGSSEETTTTRTITISAVNDAANITGDSTGDVTEAGGVANGTPGTPTASGNLDSTDVDSADDSWSAVSAGTASIQGYGTYAVTAAGVWTYTLDDTHPAVQGLPAGGTLSDSFNVTTVDGTTIAVNITVHGQDDGPTAVGDSFTTDEATPVVSPLLGNDSDPDGPSPTIAAVNGSAANVGSQFALPSGALLTVTTGGSMTWDPNGVFDATPAATSGASNQPASDSFTYTLSGGGTVTVNFTINGLDSNDTLLGTSGIDSMRGGAGHDVYFVDRVDDMVVEAAGEGRDVVYATGSHWLILPGSEVEVLSAASLAATGALDLFGNDLAQEILGNDGANVIRGGGGADVLVGRAGDDEYWVADALERVVEALGEGRDVVYASVDYALATGSHVDVLSAVSLAGTDPLALTGNELVQVILGNAGNNVIRGGGGADSLVGFGGDDVYHVVDGEQVFEAVGEGRDVVYAASHFVLRELSHVEVISTASLTGTDAINLTGSSSAQSLLGNAGANVLDGGLGADTLVGYGGADTFAFTTALGGGNVDQILDFSVADDTIALDDAVFAGLAPGALPAGAFVVGGAALDEDDRIIYDQASGALYFDADGNGAGAAVHFATVTAGTVLTANDFTVI